VVRVSSNSTKRSWARMRGTPNLLPGGMVTCSSA
jgi:hypothetical protein